LGKYVKKKRLLFMTKYIIWIYKKSTTSNGNHKQKVKYQRKLSLLLFSNKLIIFSLYFLYINISLIFLHRNSRKIIMKFRWKLNLYGARWVAHLHGNFTKYYIATCFQIKNKKKTYFYYIKVLKQNIHILFYTTI
jgi:hypothetical protein